MKIMKFCELFTLLIYSHTVGSHLMDKPQESFEIQRMDMIVDAVKFNLKKNGWCTILCFGHFTDEFYNKLQNIPYAIAITNIDRDDEDIGEVVPHHSNTIVVNLENIAQYEDTILKLINSPFWHPFSNIILLYHEQDQEILGKLYFSLWYYKAINAIIVQYDDIHKVLLLSHYSPYINDNYKLDNLYGCWTTRKITIPVSGFEEGFICEHGCHNVSAGSKLRANNLGTCIGYSAILVPYNDTNILTNLNLFDDKTKNLHGFAFRTYATEVQPFLVIDETDKGNYTIRNRDGLIWNTLSMLMNFSIDLTPSVKTMKKDFNYELNIQQIFDVSHRKADLFLIPIYLFDLVIVMIDNMVPFKESGGCILSHRAGFETTLFEGKTLRINQSIIVQFVFCFLCIWSTLSVYQMVEKKCFSFDQLGKDLMNAVRNVLSLSLCNPPRWRSFRVFLSISMWSFFIINFATQATIISFLTAVKRGKEVDTFEDVIEKGYPIYAMASPDLILPDTEERFRIINSRLIPQLDLFECVKNMTNYKRNFCLIDCAVGRYLERNKLNEHGEQYLHVAREDRMHSHYLTMIIGKHSPLTERLNKFLVTFIESGLIQKWEQYRYNDIKEEVPPRPLGMHDFKGLFNLYGFVVGFICVLFILECLIFHFKRLARCLSRKNKRFHR